MRTLSILRHLAALAGVVIGLWAESGRAEAVRLAQAVTNDLFENATVLQGSRISVTGSNVGATREPGEPRHEENEGGHSVWWSWTAPFSGTVSVNTRDSDFNTLLGVYVGGTVDSLLPAAGQNLFDGWLIEAVAGTTYRIAVDGWGGSSGRFVLSLALYAPPANDHFTNAPAILGATNTISGSNAGATRELGEPYHAQGNTMHSVWWRWAPPFTGGAELSVVGNFGFVLAVYVGDSVDRLTEVTNSAFGSRVFFNATRGTTYRIVVDGRFAEDMGDFTLTLRLSAPPSNDQFAGATVLTGANLSVQGFNVGATKEPGEPDHGGSAGGRSVWWRWTAPVTGGAEISTEGSDFANSMGVYTGASLANLTLVAEDGRSFSQSSRVIFRATQGTTYLIAVDGWNGEVGRIRLGITVSAAPPNDLFADAAVISGISNQVSGSSVGASRELGEPNHNGGAVGRSVWWRWTAPFAGEVELGTSGSAISTSTAIYTGDTLNSLARVSGGTFTGTIRFQVVAGTTYHIAIEGWNGEAGGIVLRLSLSPPPDNDRWADAIGLTGSNLIIKGSNVGASKEPGEPNHAGYAGGHSVWWKWTAPWTGGVELKTPPNGLNPLLAIYTGSSVDRLTSVASSSSSFAPAIFRAENGVTYYFAADSRDNFVGGFEVSLMLHPPVANDQFIDAIAITGTSNTVHGSNVGATREIDEPRHDFSFLGHSVWWKWTAPATGSAEVRTTGSDFGAVYGVYTGNAVTSLTVIARSSDFGSPRFAVTAGTTYWLAVDGQNGQTGNILLHVMWFPPPSNDSFAGAIEVSGPATIAGSTLGATREAGEPNHGGFLTGRSVWWNWTAPRAGEVDLQFDRGQFDVLVAVYTGPSVSRLTNIATLSSSGVFPVIAGTTYHLAVDGRSGASGEFSFRLSPIPSPPNDQFASPTMLQGANLTVSGSNRGASLEAGEPRHGGFDGGHSIWWTWTAPFTGGAEIISQGNFSFTPVLAVYTGGSLDGLTQVGTSLGYSGPVIFRAVAGTTYRIAVDGLNEGAGSVALTLRLHPPLANDQFADALEIQGPDYTAAGSNLGASKEAGEPDHAGVAGARSVWWSWTAPGTGAATLSSAGSTLRPAVAIYVGQAVDRLTEVGRMDWFDSEAVFDVQRGVKYYIAADGEPGNITLRLTFVSPPANDLFANAIAITGPIRTVVGSSLGASREAGEPNHGAQTNGHSVWWSWMAPDTGGVEIDVTGLNFSPLLAVYSGNSVTDLHPVAEDRSGEPAIFRATRGAIYRIAVDGWSGQAGDYELQVRQFPPVANDQFADAIALTEASHTVRGSNVGASREPGEPRHDFNEGGRSVWWSWTAPFSGGVTVSDQGSDFNTLLDVYTGASVDQLQRVPRIQDFDSVVFEAVAGTTYHIAVDGWGGHSGNIVLRVNLASPPPNDRFTDAIAVAGVVNRLDGSNTSASKEPGEPERPVDPGGHSVWWRWTAPFSGEAEISQDAGNELNFMVGVYTGTAVDRLTEVQLSNSRTFRVLGGATYHISVDGLNGQFGAIHLLLSLLEAPANDLFSRATILTTATNTLRGTLKGAGREPGEPPHNGEAGGHSVWWSWTAPFSGALEVVLAQSGFSPLIGVYTGDAVDALRRLEGSGNFNRQTFPVVSGVRYRIVLDGAQGYAGDFLLHLTLIPAPANDRFGDAAPLAGATALVRASNIGASREPGEPNHAGYGAGQSVWWRWVAPFSGAAEIRSESTTFTALLGVYAGNAVERLTELSAASRNSPSRVIFQATAGTTYSIAVDSSVGQSGDFDLALSLVPFVTNDRFVDAIPLAGSSNLVQGSNLGATAEIGEPSHGGYAVARSVWWTWTAPFDGGVEINTAESGFDTIVAAYTGSSLGNLSPIQRNYGEPNFASRLRFSSVGGTTYHIAVDGRNYAQGNIALRLKLLPPPANDQFDRATVITGTNHQEFGSNFGASTEPGEPDHEGRLGKHSIWWVWSAPMTGGVEISTAGSEFETALAVYTGGSVDALSRVAVRAFGSRRSFRAIAGTTYHFAVDGTYGGFGNVAFGLVTFPAVANDQFAEASVLSGTNVVARGSNVGATKEPGEPNHGFGQGGHSVWWSWTAPFNGGLTLSAETPAFEQLIGIYTGDSVTNLTTVWNSPGDGPARFAVEAGRTYHLAVDGWNGEVGEIDLSLNLSPPPANDLFTNRIRISGASQELSGSLLGAGKEAGEPDHAGVPCAHSIWWSWTAPFSGGLELSFGPGDYGFQVGVYSGEEIPGLTEVARSNDTGIMSLRVIEGAVYQIAVDQSNGQGLDFTLQLALHPGVENDQFVDALNLSGETVVAKGSNVGATAEAGEPEHASYMAGHSIWWNWTAPFSGGVEIRSDESDIETRLGVYTGEAVDHLAPVNLTDMFGSIRFSVERGTTYRIAVDSWNRETGKVSFRLRLLPPPVNDQFENALPVLGTIAAIRGTTFGAGKEPGEPNHAGESGGQSVWWRWTAPYTGGVEFMNSQGLYQALIGVYTGNSVNALELAADTQPGALPGFRAVEGTTYYFAVDSQETPNLDFALYFRLLPPVANDQFADAIPIVGASSRVLGSNVGATSELGEPTHAGRPPTRSVWWSWTAPFSGKAVFSTAGSDFSAVLGVYTGDSLTSLTEVTRADTTETHPFRAQAGRTYHIAVSSPYGNPGQIFLRVELGPCTDQITVINTRDDGPGSLRQAIADICPGGIIQFDAGIVGQAILVTNGPLAIDRNLTIAGPGAGRLAITAELRNSVFEILRGVVTISELTIQGGSNGFGGGVVNHGRLTLAGCVVKGNQASSGGGGVLNGFDSSLTILDSTLSTNIAEFGGALYNAGQVVVINTTIGPANSAFAGGGYYGSGDLFMTNSTVAGNSASRSGGGLAAERRSGFFSPFPSRVGLASCTVASNTARFSGGGYAQVSESNLELWNTLIARNEAPSEPDVDRFRPVTSIGYNLIGAVTSSLGWTNTDLIGTVSDPIDPRLGPLQDNGGPTFTLALAHDSPAGNRGDPDYVGPPFTDQRGSGFARVAGRIDIGAWERQNESPRLACPPASPLECNGPTGTPASLAVTVQDPDGDALGVTWTVNGNVVQTNLLPAGTTAQPSVINYAASFGPGTHTIVVTMSDGINAAAVCATTVTVQDTLRPTLRLLGPNPLTNLNLTAFVDPGAQAGDVCDGDLTSRIVVTGPPDLARPGQHTLVYSVADDSGNGATTTRLVVVVGWREVQQTMLAQLNALRTTVTDRSILKKLDEARGFLNGTLSPEFWADSTHLRRQHGEKAFMDSRKAVDRLVEASKGTSDPVLAAALEGLAIQIARAMRAIAAFVIQEGRQAGGDPARLDAAGKDLAQGDDQLAEGRPDKAIDSYKHAWKTAVGASVNSITHLKDGAVRLEIAGFPGETYTIQSSTDLLHWKNLAARTADQSGVVTYQDSNRNPSRARFYRLKH